MHFSDEYKVSLVRGAKLLSWVWRCSKSHVYARQKSRSRGTAGSANDYLFCRSVNEGFHHIALHIHEHSLSADTLQTVLKQDSWFPSLHSYCICKSEGVSVPSSNQSCFYVVAGVLSDLVGGVCESVSETGLQEERLTSASEGFRRCNYLTTKTLESSVLLGKLIFVYFLGKQHEWPFIISMTCVYVCGLYSGAVVFTPTSKREAPGSNPICVEFVCSSVQVLVFSMYSSLLPQSKNRLQRIRITLNCL